MSLDRLMIRPFLKWPGRKYSIMPILKRHIYLAKHPNICDSLVEPFLGSGTVFLNTDYKKYYLADCNPDLINLYLYLINDKDKFIKLCHKYFITRTNEKNIYYELRDEFNNLKSSIKKSALFLYLNRHGYNGLCRYNNAGLYNVPFGRYKQVILPIKNMQLFYEKATSVRVKIDCLDFKDCLQNIKNKSIIYCDPPYVPLSDTASFTKYAKSDFNLSHQKMLVDLVKQLQNDDISSLISNHDSKITRQLYHGAQIISFPVKRYISCRAYDRQEVKELLAIYSAEKL